MSQGFLYIKTYGCQMNFYDSSKIVDLLQPHGFCLTQSPENANIVVLNTCHIRENASEKVYSALGKIGIIKEKKKKEGKHFVVIVTGCTAQSEGEEIIKRAPYVDIVVGPQSYHDIPMLIAEVKRRDSWVTSLDFKEDEKFDILANTGTSQGYTASISVMEGCDKFCHFCVVPYTRGSEFSRPVNQIYDEVIKLTKHGSRNFMLLGQNISAYRGLGPDGAKWNLGKLISYICKIDTVFRVSYMTSHPIDMDTSGMLETHSEEAKLMPFMHLPIQSGSDRVLKAMNRKYNTEYYLKIIESFRAAKPDIAFSSDFIVGYPSETDEDFRQTLEIVDKVKWAQAYSFKYSPRPGTPAAIINEQIDEEVKQKRLLTLQAILGKNQAEFNNAQIGKTLSVAFDERGKKANQVLGKSQYMQSVVVNDGLQHLNSISNVKIISATQNSLHGIVV